MELSRKNLGREKLEDFLKKELRSTCSILGVEISDKELRNKISSLVYFSSWNLKLETGIGIYTPGHEIYPIYFSKEDLERVRKNIQDNPPFLIQRNKINGGLYISNYSENISLFLYNSPLSSKEKEWIEKFTSEFGGTIKIIENINEKLNREEISAVQPVLFSHSLERLRYLKDYLIERMSEVSISKKNVERLKNVSSESFLWLKVFNGEDEIGSFNLNTSSRI